jgi:hypothetical protein
MFIGVKITVLKTSFNQDYHQQEKQVHYSPPLIIHKFNDLDHKQCFLAQLIRDVDFSFYYEKGEKIELEIMVYPDKNTHRLLNNGRSINTDSIKILGKYELNGSNIEFNFINTKINKSGKLKKYIMEDSLEIEFTTFNTEDNLFIISTPSIKGYMSFLSDI